MHPTMPRALRRATQSKRVILHSLTLHPQQKPTRWTCLAATPIINQNGGSVDFKMQHALTKVVFNVKSNDDITGKVITASPLREQKAGHWLFMCRQTMTTRVSVGLIRQRLLPKHLPLPQKSLSVPDKSTPEEAMLCTYFLLPTNIGNTFNITYTYIGIKGTQTVTLTNQPLPSLDKWLSGAFVRLHHRHRQKSSHCHNRKSSHMGEWRSGICGRNN